MDNICQMEHITKRFGEKVVLDDFSLCVKAGEMLCIAGVSGSGKSTILNIIGMFEGADSGEISLFGQSQPKLNSKKVAHCFSLKCFTCFKTTHWWMTEMFLTI